MKRAFKALIAALAIANAAYWVAPWLEGAGAEESKIPADVNSQALTPLAEHPQEELGKGGEIACMKIAGVGPEARDAALAALGPRLGGRAFASSIESWTVQSKAAYPEKVDAEKAARDMAAKGWKGLSPHKAAGGWIVRSEGFASQREAIESIPSKWAASASVAKDQQELYDIRFGPWQSQDVEALAKTAVGMGAAGSEQCNQKEAQEWLSSKK